MNNKNNKLFKLILVLLVFSIVLIIFIIQSIAKPEDYYWMANSKFETKNYSGAITDLNKALSLDSNNANFFNLRGASFQGLGETNRALDDYYKSIQIDPYLTVAYKNIIEIYSNQLNHEGLVEIYTKVIKVYPQDDKSINNRGISNEYLKNFTQAMTDFSKAIEINSKCEPALKNRARLKIKLKDFYGALKDLNSAIEINPQKVELYNERATIKRRLNDNQGACQDWSIAGDLGDKFAYDSIQKYCNTKAK
jgi:tetratricopeptide (TPR) repeat protein